MLKQRLLTAFILIPPLLWVLTLSSQILAGVAGLFVVLGAWEWARLCGWQTKTTRILYTILFSFALLLTYQFRDQMVTYILWGACLWWFIALFWILRYQQTQSIPLSPLLKAILGVVILLPSWLAVLHLHEHEQYGWTWVIFLLVLIWAADSGAYFAGKRFGKRKLAPQISPGKTYEGVVGALLMSLIVSLLYALNLSISPMALILFLLLCLLTVMASILGDLLESLFKRQAGVKDSSHILPGHGGILDRIDSLTAAAPIFVIGLISLGSLL
jgi:phosphatidate cytidylyltransferase